MTTGVLTFELEGTTALIRMDDGKANALSDAMISALVEALERAQKVASAAILVGRPDRFCAGFDLRAMMASPDSAKALLRRGADLLMKLYGLPIPLVIACTGHALAGGALVLLTGDIRIGSSGPYRIGLNEVSIGMPVPILGVSLARERIAPRELSRATLLAQIYGPEEAVKAGFLDEVVASAEVLGRAKSEAARLAGLARPAFQATKERLRGQMIAHVLATLEDDMKSLAMPTA